jgi:hypothetical protein
MGRKTYALRNIGRGGVTVEADYVAGAGLDLGSIVATKLHETPSSRRACSAARPPTYLGSSLSMLP